MERYWNSEENTTENQILHIEETDKEDKEEDNLVECQPRDSPLVSNVVIEELVYKSKDIAYTELLIHIQTYFEPIELELISSV